MAQTLQCTSHADCLVTDCLNNSMTYGCNCVDNRITPYVGYPDPAVMPWTLNDRITNGTCNYCIRANNTGVWVYCPNPPAKCEVGSYDNNGVCETCPMNFFCKGDDKKVACANNYNSPPNSSKCFTFTDMPPMQVLENNVCGKMINNNTLTVSGLLAEGQWNSYPFYVVDNNTATAYGADRTSNPQYIRVKFQKPTTLAAGIVRLDAYAPERGYNFEIWVGNSDVGPSNNQLCYRSNNTRVNYELFTCGLTGLYMYFARTSNINDYMLLSDLALYRSCSCLPGFVLNNASDCDQCPVSTYSNTTNAGSCISCPENMTSPVGSVTSDACVCKTGYYLDSSQSCKACPDGSWCANSTVSLCSTCGEGKIYNTAS